MIETIRLIWQNWKLDRKAFMLAYWSRVILEFITMANPFIIKIIID